MKQIAHNGYAAGVTISVEGHPEYGQTISREDGLFDLAVNGGGYLTVKYSRYGFLSAQRQVNVPWQDYTWLPEVILIKLDNQVTSISVVNNTSIQVAQGNPVVDADGIRRATLIFPENTKVLGYSGDVLHIRATEYTVMVVFIIQKTQLALINIIIMFTG